MPRKCSTPRIVPHVHLVVALVQEARPLINHFRLKAAKGCDSFRVFGGEDVSLIVSGPGKISAAAATSFLHVHLGGLRNRLWLNVGIGGHRSLPIGMGVLAHKITDSASGRSWYPPIVFHPPSETKSLLTVDQPVVSEARPPGDCPQRDRPACDADLIYEMEAAGFYDTATRFSTAELVQSFKVISDHCDLSGSISADFVERLMAAQLGTIDLILERMRPLAAEVAFPQFSDLELEPFRAHWHFTVSEENRLHRLLKRLKTLEPKRRMWRPELESLRAPKEVLHFLEDEIRTLPTAL